MADHQYGARRRSVVKGALAAGVSAPALWTLLSACGTKTSSSATVKIPSPTTPVTWPMSKVNEAIAAGQKPKAGTTLRIYNYADYLSPRVLKDFEEKYGVNIRLSTFNDADEALTKVASKQLKFDLYFPSYDQIAKMVTAKLIRPLNHSYIPNIANVWPEFTDPWYDGKWNYTVPYTVYTTGIGWRADKVNIDVASMPNPYDVFWDTELARKIAVIDDWHTAMAMVALRGGITDINTTKPKDIAKIQALMLDMQQKTNPKVTITMYNDLPAGQLNLCQMWSGDVVNAQYHLPKGVSTDVLAYWFPPDGKGMVDNDLMVILSQGQNPVLAHLFVNFMLDTKNALKNFGYIGYQPPQTSLTPEQTVSDGYVPANLTTAVVRKEWFGAGYRLLELPPVADAAWHQVWQRFKAGA